MASVRVVISTQAFEPWISLFASVRAQPWTRRIAATHSTIDAPAERSSWRAPSRVRPSVSRPRNRLLKSRGDTFWSNLDAPEPVWCLKRGFWPSSNAAALHQSRDFEPRYNLRVVFSSTKAGFQRGASGRVTHLFKPPLPGEAKRVNRFRSSRSRSLFLQPLPGIEEPTLELSRLTI